MKQNYPHVEGNVGIPMAASSYTPLALKARDTLLL